jgi:hypothetical protein
MTSTTPKATVVVSHSGSRRYPKALEGPHPSRARGAAMTATFTKTEATRRLRVLSAAARRAERVGRTALVEVGDRNIRVVSMQRPGFSPDDEGRTLVDGHRVSPVWYAEGDDLWTTRTLRDTIDQGDIAVPGAVVHLYVGSGSNPDAYGYELAGICCGWMGTADAEPVLLDADGSPFDPEDDPTTTDVEYRPSEAAL